MNATNEARKLMRLVEVALYNYNLEEGGDFKELPLDDEVTLVFKRDDKNIVVYAVTQYSVVATNGERIKFLRLGLDDIRTIEDIVKNVYDIEL